MNFWSKEVSSWQFKSLLHFWKTDHKTAQIIRPYFHLKEKRKGKGKIQKQSLDGGYRLYFKITGPELSSWKKIMEQTHWGWHRTQTLSHPKCQVHYRAQPILAKFLKLLSLSALGMCFLWTERENWVHYSLDWKVLMKESLLWREKGSNEQIGRGSRSWEDCWPLSGDSSAKGLGAAPSMGKGVGFARVNSKERQKLK